jgi:hypothetical protein
MDSIRGKVKLGEDVLKHVVGRAPDDVNGALLDEVADVMAFDVNAFGLIRCGHVVGSKGNAALVVLKGSGWASEGRTNCGK